MKTYFLIALLLVFFTSLRFYNLNWGAPYYFHPDERNIASSVAQLHFPSELNPHFFAYGSFPIYGIYITGIIINYSFFLLHKITNSQILQLSFEQAIIISRFYSALFSVLLIPSIFIIGKKIASHNTGLIAAFFAASSVGLLQFAHFGTFEMWLTFFILWFFFFCTRLIKSDNRNNIWIAGTLLGLLLSIKIVTLVLIPFPFVALFIHTAKKYRGYGKKIIILLTKLFLLYGTAASIFVVTCPYAFLDKTAFINTITYESGIGLGTISTFYTQEFYNKPLIIFQLQHVLPFLINPFLVLLFFPALIYVSIHAIKQKNQNYLFLLAFLFVLLFSQGLLFVKWTRYMVPILPFFYLIISIFLTKITLSKKFFNITLCSMGILFVVCVIFSVSYIISSFSIDTRVSAAKFAKQRISSTAPIISETYDLGITAFNPFFSNITLYNFYDIDSGNAFDKKTFLSFIKSANYIILPSQRVAKIRLTKNNIYPNGNMFYTKLFNGSLGYVKIYETPCDIFCKITYLNNPVNSYEETASVFDRPTIYIFKNNEKIF